MHWDEDGIARSWTEVVASLSIIAKKPAILCHWLFFTTTGH
jgi:hypothetical protein